jgi:hypothetical protein
MREKIWVMGNERTRMLGLPITPNMPIDSCTLTHEETFGLEDGI